MTDREFYAKLRGGAMSTTTQINSEEFLRVFTPLLEAGQDVMLEIDPQGAKSVKLRIPDAVLVFIMPPSYKELERRIRGRGTETEEQIEKRLSCAVGEINTLAAYDYVIINADIQAAVDNLKAIIAAERCKVSRNTSLPTTFILEKDSE